MNKLNIFKQASLALATLFSGIVVTGSVALALPYTGATTVASPVPAFNVYKPTAGNPLPAPAPSAGEQDFFQGRVPVNGNANTDTRTPYVDSVNTSCTDGQIVQLRIYVHNGADAAANNNGSGPSVAHNTNVKVDLSPKSNGSGFDPMATISSSNAATVSDDVLLNCLDKTTHLEYVKDSASQYSVGTNAATPLSDAIIGAGVPIQSEKVAGDVWGCWNERVLVVLSVKLVTTPQPPVTPPVTPPVVPPTVTATCDLFQLVAADDKKNRTVTVKDFKFTAQNVNFKNVVIDWGDGAAHKTPPITDANAVKGTTHTYDADGSYNATAVVTFSNDATAGGTGVCASPVSISSTTPPVTPPVTPPATPVKKLVNTGAGSVLGLFAAVSVLGAFAHRVFLGRRLGQN